MPLVTSSAVSIACPKRFHVGIAHHIMALCVDGLELMFIGIGFVTIPVVVLIYTRINANRDVRQREMEEKGVRLTPEEIRELGDRAPDFRYTI